MNNQRVFLRINAQTASQLLTRDNVLVLDSRDQGSYDLARIASARRLSSDNLDATLIGTPRTSRRRQSRRQ